MTQDQVIKDIGRFYNYLSKREAKYLRNFNRYSNNGARRSSIHNLYDTPLSYLYTGMQSNEDAGIMPILNVVRSATETLVSKVSQTKVRPFFNPVNGTYKTRKVAKAAQVFFDEFYDAQDVYANGVKCLRDAAVFEVGHLWVDDDESKIKRIAPWEYYYDPAELNFGKITRCYVRFNSYPAIALRDKLGKKSKTLSEAIAADVGAKVEYIIFYDLIDGLKHYVVGSEYVMSKKIDYDVSPVATLYYSPPIKGGFSVSLVDNLYTIQRQIDSLCQRIHDAAELNPGNQIFIPKGSNIKASEFNNQFGAIWEYMPLPNAGPGVVVSTPRPIDPQYVQLLELFEQRAYQMEGISQLSAQSKKPTGINAGVALQTLDDIESERHNVILNAYIKFLMDVAKVAIEVFPNDAEILPTRLGRANIKWSDIKAERKQYTIQFSASSSLSKDPKTKMEQVEKLLSLGVINPDMASSLLEFPDLEDAYGVASASYDACSRIIERCIETGDVDYYEAVDVRMLYRETINTLLRLDANDEDTQTLGKLVVLLTKVKGDMAMIQEATQPPPPAPAPMPEPLPAGPALPVAPPMGAM